MVAEYEARALRAMEGFDVAFGELSEDGMGGLER